MGQRTPRQKVDKVLAMTTINTSTNLLKIDHLTTKTSAECATASRTAAYHSIQDPSI